MVCTPQVKKKKSDGKNGQIIGEVCSLSILAL